MKFLPNTVILLFVNSFLINSCSPPPSLNKPIPELVKNLKSDDTVIRAETAVALGMRKSESVPAIPNLVLLLGDQKAIVRNRAMDALVKIGTPSIPALIEATNHYNRIVRFYAAHALEKLPGADARAAYDAYMAKEGKDLIKTA